MKVLSYSTPLHPVGFFKGDTDTPFCHPVTRRGDLTMHMWRMHAIYVEEDIHSSFCCSSKKVVDGCEAGGHARQLSMLHHHWEATICGEQPQTVNPQPLS